MTIKMTSIPVKNPIEAHQYYTEVLGFQSFMFMPEAQLAIVVSSENPKGTTLFLEPIGSTFYQTFQEEAYRQGLPILILGSEDVKAEFQRLSEKGVKFKQEPKTNEWGTSAVFEDSCGNYIQIHQDV
ncbi:MAG: VOC family protein [Saprospiraceae bacterium]|nr:VOC family protein [Saprospiraceae bacterium]|tara:strand:+ start:1164 stop:1544 length:381 start_codon:yes stop_codon:yes gene_type:complete